MNEIVKYNNNLNISLKDFKATEMNLLMVLFSKVKEKGIDTVTISFDEIKKLSGYKATSSNRFISDLISTNRKLMNLQMEYEDGPTRYQFVLFPTFAVNRQDLYLTVEVNPRFAYLLNNIQNNFTRFELEEFKNLKSVYSKALYRLLKQWRSVGKYTISLERFKELLDIPENYTPSAIDARVIKPIEEELSLVFNNFKITKEYKAPGKRGRSILSGFIITFTPEKRVQNVCNVPVKSSGVHCPICGQILYEKVINGSNCWCHIDGWKKEATCHKIFNSMYEIKNYNEPSSIKESPRSGDTKSIREILQSIQSDLL